MEFDIYHYCIQHCINFNLHSWLGREEARRPERDIGVIFNKLTPLQRYLVDIKVVNYPFSWTLKVKCHQERFGVRKRTLLTCQNFCHKVV